RLEGRRRRGGGRQHWHADLRRDRGVRAAQSRAQHGLGRPDQGREAADRPGAPALGPGDVVRDDARDGLPAAGVARRQRVVVRAIAARVRGWDVLSQIVNFVVSFGVITFLFCATYKILPDVRIGWRVVWFGGAVTALLFTLGKELIGMYLGRDSLASVYGAA